MQEVVRELLDAYFEPTFSDASHGFRKGARLSYSPE
jgi:retron-type reverse transcriptase